MQKKLGEKKLTELNKIQCCELVLWDPCNRTFHDRN